MAYIGQASVRLQAGVEALPDDLLVPSGANDGTATVLRVASATAAAGRGALLQLQKRIVGRVLEKARVGGDGLWTCRSVRGQSAASDGDASIRRCATRTQRCSGIGTRCFDPVCVWHGMNVHRASVGISSGPLPEFVDALTTEFGALHQRVEVLEGQLQQLAIKARDAFCLGRERLDFCSTREKSEDTQPAADRGHLLRQTFDPRGDGVSAVGGPYNDI